jgi:hypothetical protein
VSFNIRNTLPKSGTFLLGPPVYIATPYNFQAKVNFTIEQAMKAHKRGRGIDLLFL